MRMAKVITIDGPSGAGKSTIARILSAKIGFDYLDTGALYRAVALKLLREGLKESSEDEEILKILRKTSVIFRDGEIFLDGKDVSKDIRTMKVGHYSSLFSTRKVVRDFLIVIQRNAAEGRNMVAEGRDMATVVFPHAWKKLFLTATAEERARRRHVQFKEKKKTINMDEAMRDVMERDRRDHDRSFAPLRKADDAVLIDNSKLSIDGTIKEILEILKD